MKKGRRYQRPFPVLGARTALRLRPHRALASGAQRQFTIPSLNPSVSTFELVGVRVDYNLNKWIKEAKEDAHKTGHLGVTLTQIGHVLKHAPADPDGLWIHRAVADILNEKDADGMRDGFWTENFNERGAHWVDPTGAPERKFSIEWAEKAEAVEAAGYHLLAGKMRTLAVYYTKEADRIVEEHKHENA